MIHYQMTQRFHQKRYNCQPITNNYSIFLGHRRRKANSFGTVAESRQRLGAICGVIGLASGCLAQNLGKQTTCWSHGWWFFYVTRCYPEKNMMAKTHNDFSENNNNCLTAKCHKIRKTETTFTYASKITNKWGIKSWLPQILDSQTMLMETKTIYYEVIVI